MTLDICKPEDFQTILSKGDSVQISSPNFPSVYSVKDLLDPYTTPFCSQSLSADDDGIFLIKPIITNISFEDVIGFGYGHFPSFTTTVYGITGQNGSPIRGDYPHRVEILGVGKSRTMWVLFVPAFHRHGIFQHHTADTGFLVHIERGKYKGKR